MFRGSHLIIGAICLLPLCGGCSLILPEVAQQPVIRNPFPQLRRVAIAPFFNQSDEETVDGRQVAMAYFTELQSTPGFEVVPLGVVEEAIIDNRVDLSGPGEARRLAQILGVDAVIVGSVTDFSEYYPPRLGLRVEWYTANPGYHEIPAGYGLPWNTPEEEFIPDSLVYESQMAAARVQMAGQAPDCAACQTLPAPPAITAPDGAIPLPSDVVIETPTPIEPVPPLPAPPLEEQPAPPEGNAKSSEDAAQAPESAPESTPALQNASPPSDSGNGAVPTSPSETLPTPSTDPAARRQRRQSIQLAQAEALFEEKNVSVGASAPTTGAAGATPPRGQVAAGVARTGAQVAVEKTALSCPAACSPETMKNPGNPPPCVPYDGPVLSHTRVYNGNDGDVVEALRGYVSFRQDQRYGGWKSYLRRSDDYVRFCCHMHIAEMLSARGGSRKTQVVWRWPESR